MTPHSHHQPGYSYPFPDPPQQSYDVESVRWGTAPYVCVISYERVHPLILFISECHAPDRTYALRCLARGLHPVAPCSRRPYVHSPGDDCGPAIPFECLPTLDAHGHPLPRWSRTLPSLSLIPARNPQPYITTYGPWWTIHVNKPAGLCVAPSTAVCVDSASLRSSPSHPV